MPGCLVNVKYRFLSGKEHTYTLAVKQMRGGVSTQPIDQGFLTDIIGPRVRNGDYSLITSTNPSGQRSVVESILAFLVGMMTQQVTLTKVYISDGATPGAATGAFAAFPINIPCTWSAFGIAAPSADQVAPGNQCLLLGKAPALLGLRSGHWWLRYVLRSSDITTGADDETSFHDPGYAASYNSAVIRAEGNSNIQAFYVGITAANGPVMFGQAQFYSKAEQLANPSLKGALKVVQNITDMSMIDAQNRQAKRGRKQKVSTTQAQIALRERGIVLTEEQMDILQLQVAAQDNGWRPDESSYPDEQEAYDLAELEASRRDDEFEFAVSDEPNLLPPVH